MANVPFVSRHSEGNWLNVLGMEVKFLCKDKDSHGRFSAMLNTIPKGLGAPPHSHPWDEGYYLLNGKIKFVLNGQCHVLHTGDFAYAPAGTVHSFEGLSDQEGTLLIIDSPSHSSRFFQEINDAIQVLPDDLPKMQGIGERHKVKFA